MEASRVIIGDKTYDMNHLGKKKKTNIRRKLIIEYIQSKPAGEYITMDKFKEIGCFTAYANAWSFVGRMIRDGVIQQFEGEKKGAYYYSVTDATRLVKARKELSLPEDQPVPVSSVTNPDINAFVADMQRLGVEFTITITNKKA